MSTKISNYLEKKSTFGKLSDLLFILFIGALLFPQGRMAIGGFVNNLKAQVSNPSKLAHEISIAEDNFNWELIDQQGSIVNLKDHKGKVLFINLWATWCPPCVGEMPEIQQLYDEFKSEDGIEFLMISNQNMTKINRFLKSKNYNFPAYSTKFRAPTAFSTQTIPTTFVVSKSGKIVIKKIGAANWGGKKMKKLVRELLAE